MRNKHLKFIDKHNLSDALLREFIVRGLWDVAVRACDTAIERRETEIFNLKKLKLALVEEMGK